MKRHSPSVVSLWILGLSLLVPSLAYSDYECRFDFIAFKGLYSTEKGASARGETLKEAAQATISDCQRQQLLGFLDKNDCIKQAAEPYVTSRKLSCAVNVPKANPWGPDDGYFKRNAHAYFGNAKDLSNLIEGSAPSAVSINLEKPEDILKEAHFGIVTNPTSGAAK
jgi:hypothetical protein